MRLDEITPLHSGESNENGAEIRSDATSLNALLISNIPDSLPVRFDALSSEVTQRIHNRTQRIARVINRHLGQLGETTRVPMHSHEMISFLLSHALLAVYDAPEPTPLTQALSGMTDSMILYMHSDVGRKELDSWIDSEANDLAEKLIRLRAKRNGSVLIAHYTNGNGHTPPQTTGRNHTDQHDIHEFLWPEDISALYGVHPYSDCNLIDGNGVEIIEGN